MSASAVQARIQARIREAATLLQRGQLPAAEERARAALALEPRSADATHLLAIVCGTQGRHEEARQHFAAAAVLDPANPALHYGHAKALSELRRDAEALAHHHRACDLAPGNAHAWLNFGVSLHRLGRREEALQCYRTAFRIHPAYAEALSGAGALLVDLGRHAEAMAIFDRALEVKPADAESLAGKGLCLTELGRHDEARGCFERAMAIRPTLDFLPGYLIQSKLLTCDWDGLDALVAAQVERVMAGEAALAPFIALQAADSPAVQGQAARTWTRRRFPPQPGPAAAAAASPAAPAGRIRLGYFSAEFREHAVSYLTAGLFESHDRRRFDVLGFSCGGARAGDPMRRRLESAFDRFIDLSGLDDDAAAQVARAESLDIAIDLGGHTGEARTGLFARRVAPVQVNYLGFPATMGAGYIDYIVADATVIPPASGHHVQERVVRLPHCFQVNDSRRPVARRQGMRAGFGLPERGFVYCCFNSVHKITPAQFGRWMRILAGVEAGVLWLLDPGPAARGNLQREAQSRGIDPGRLVFGGRLPQAEYLARYRSADLFLDTLPFNGGTTASDALWAGLPVLTQAGESFAGRMAASLLFALGLPGLVAASAEAYESLAIALGTQPGLIARHRRRLAQLRDGSRLFRAEACARDLERAYEAMQARRAAGLDPVDIDLSAGPAATT